MKREIVNKGKDPKNIEKKPLNIVIACVLILQGLITEEDEAASPIRL